MTDTASDESGVEKGNLEQPKIGAEGTATSIDGTERKIRFLEQKRDNEFDQSVASETEDEDEDEEAALVSLNKTESLTNRFEPLDDFDEFSLMTAAATSAAGFGSKQVCQISIHSSPNTDPASIKSDSKYSKAFTNGSGSTEALTFDDSTVTPQNDPSILTNDKPNDSYLVKSISDTDTFIDVAHNKRMEDYSQPSTSKNLFLEENSRIYAQRSNFLVEEFSRSSNAGLRNSGRLSAGKNKNKKDKSSESQNVPELSTILNRNPQEGVNSINMQDMVNQLQVDTILTNNLREEKKESSQIHSEPTNPQLSSETQKKKVNASKDTKPDGLEQSVNETIGPGLSTTKKINQDLKKESQSEAPEKVSKKGILVRNEENSDSLSEFNSESVQDSFEYNDSTTEIVNNYNEQRNQAYLKFYMRHFSNQAVADGNSPSTSNDNNAVADYQYDYQQIMSTMLGVNQHRIGAGGGHVDPAIQKSIFSTPTILHPQYRLLVSDQTSPEIITNGSQHTLNSSTSQLTRTVEVDVHSMPGDDESMQRYQETGLATFSANVTTAPAMKSKMKLKECDSKTGNCCPPEHLDEEPPPIFKLTRIIKTDGLKWDTDQSDHSDTASSITSDTDNLYFPLKELQSSNLVEKKKISSRSKLLRKKKKQMSQPVEEEKPDKPVYQSTTTPVVTSQPSTAAASRRRPKSWANKNSLPASLEFLEITNILLVDIPEKMSFRFLTHFDEKRDQVFRFRDQTGTTVLYGVERPHVCPIGTCTSGRPFNMYIYDNTGAEIMKLSRHASCLMGGCLIPCLWQELKVYCPPNKEIGRIQENITLAVPTFTVYNNLYGPVARFMVRGPIGASLFNRNIDFLIYNKNEDDTHIGVITNFWWDDIINNNSELKNLFGVKYPTMDDQLITPRMKVLLLGCAILIKYIYYNKQKKRVVPEFPPEAPRPRETVTASGEGTSIFGESFAGHFTKDDVEPIVAEKKTAVPEENLPEANPFDKKIEPIRVTVAEASPPSIFSRPPSPQQRSADEKDSGAAGEKLKTSETDEDFSGKMRKSPVDVNSRTDTANADKNISEKDVAKDKPEISTNMIGQVQ